MSLLLLGPLRRARTLFVYRPQLEFCYDLRLNKIVPTPLPEGARFVFPCDTEDVHNLSFESGRTEQNAILRYMEGGDQLALILIGDNVACRGLVRSTGALTLEGQRNSRSLGKGEVFIHYCRTAEAFSGQKLYSTMLVHTLMNLTQRFDLRKATITCRDNNVPSIKGIQRAGFKLHRRLKTLGLLGGRVAYTWSEPTESYTESLTDDE